jgi:Mce-associated membrane protein
LFASLVTVISALLITAVTLFHAHAHYTDEQERTGQILASVRQMATDLTTISGADVAGQADKIAAQTVGTFRDQFGSQRQNFLAIVQQARVTSVGEVRAVGLLQADNVTAQALAAVSAHVSNQESPTGQQRQYRMRVTLRLVDGRWLVSDVELVP